ncbi:Glycine betaine/L-proline transport substrate-binding protein ProX [Candidatus Syntrophocurvum alkaliphilum]|uniref:Glycine betaine/L-proline transport substrate-binding protein ProX n=1 Tax=Candidatus Syntrophocurvum alkaliphilum TaxID=2293317 RepID=A0A6I6DH33_9FIRM|nr:ABC transporter substrate-binding protein [Candidatus Syntrophocurvum alkaliphilum]QGU00270.1 Glycine betaine/L-proline transport substrate-binding protein ProX [Candidatus Syntrophocurvum alkaliphilum]
MIGLRKKKYLSLLLVILLSSALLFTAGCGGQDTDGQATITFGNADWDSIKVHNHVARIIIEEGYNYNTDEISGSSDAIFQALTDGDVDVFMENWSNNRIDIYEEALERGDVVQASLNFDGSYEGLWVPTYMIEGDPDRGIEPMTPDLRTVKDLKDYWEVFEDPEEPGKGRIYGSIPGWTTDEIFREKLENYGLLEYYNYFSPGSDTALATSMITAYERGLPWVGYYWEPTWVISMLDMTLLEDEPFDQELWDSGYLCELPPQPVYVDVHQDFPERKPEVMEFLKNYETSSEMTGEALLYMQENDANEKEAAIWFLNEYEDLWTSWVPAEVADKVKQAL